MICEFLKIVELCTEPCQRATLFRILRSGEAIVCTFNEKYLFRYLKVSASADSPPGDMCAVYRTDRSGKISISIFKNFTETFCRSSSDSGIN